MRNLKKYVIISLSFLLFSCGPDFGDKIKKWVDNNARSYSEKLTRADLQVRWLNQFTEHYRTISVYQKEISNNLKENYDIILLNNISKETDLSTLLKRNDRTRNSFDKLLKLKSKIDATNILFENLDSIGSIKQFQNAGLRAIGKETLLRSFTEIGNRAEVINNLRYKSFFNIKFTLKLGEDGSVSSEVDHSEGVQASSYECPDTLDCLGQWISDWPIVGSIISVFVEPKIEEQKEIVKEALNDFDKLCLQPKEQYEISLDYVKEARVYYKKHHAYVDSIRNKQLISWGKLFEINEGIRLKTNTDLMKFRQNLSEQEFRGQAQITRIISEEESFKLREDIVIMIVKLQKAVSELQVQKGDLKTIEKIEAISDAINEAKYILKNLNEQSCYTGILSFIENSTKSVTFIENEMKIKKKQMRL